MTEVHVNLIGPWIILQRPSKSPKLSAKPHVKQPLQVLALTMIDLSTNLLKLIVVSDKESRTVAGAFDCSWLCRYIRVQDILIRGFCVDNFIFILIIFKT
jgi:hypothetical protein